jgi:unsaturated chondroitin disaccharide hydrolase
MAIKIDSKLTPAKLQKKIERVFDLAGQKILNLDKSW